MRLFSGNDALKYQGQAIQTNSVQHFGKVSCIAALHGDGEGVRWYTLAANNVIERLNQIAKACLTCSEQKADQLCCWSTMTYEVEHHGHIAQVGGKLALDAQQHLHEHAQQWSGQARTFEVQHAVA